MHKHNILRLDIAMQYLMPVHQTHSIEQISYHERGSFLREGLAARDDIEELSIAA